MSTHAPITYSHISARLPKCLALIVIDYFQSTNQCINHFALRGEYERCINAPDVASCFFSACRAGHREIVNLMIARGSNEWNWGMAWACRGGHRAIVDIMIAQGANDWDDGMAEACRGGHREIVDMMISLGANDWLWGMEQARYEGYQEIVDLLTKLSAADAPSRQ